MIAVDTNLLARFYCDDPQDVEAARQRPIARRILLESPSVFVPLSVILEFEWVMRGFYDRDSEDFCAVAEHLMGMSQVTVERWEIVSDAIVLHRQGLDFADALHWVTSKHCDQLVTFDDRGFARKSRRLGLVPEVNLAR